MSGPQSGFKVGKHSRINTGDASDQVLVANKPGWLDGMQVFNLSSASLIILKLYDSSVTPTTAMTPFWRGPIPFTGTLSTGSLNDLPAGGGFVFDTNNPWPVDLGLGYAVCAGSALADNVNTTAAANLCVVNMQFQTSTVG